MLTKSIAVAAVLALTSGAAHAQDIKKNNDNVTKVDVSAGDIRAKGMTNPAQTKVRAQVPGQAKVQVHAKNNPTSDVPSVDDLDIQVRELNENVTKVDGTVGDFRVKGITTPGQTKVKVQDPGQIKVQVQAKPPKR